MKCTGIVRRMDELGRVVIPKELRRTLHICEGDPLEIYVGNDGEIIFKRYSPVHEMKTEAKLAAESLSKATNSPVIICDINNAIVARSGLKYSISSTVQNIENIMRDRRVYINSKAETQMFPLDDYNYAAKIIAPIIEAGDVFGAIIVLDSFDSSTENEMDLSLCTKAFARFFGSLLGEG